MGPTYSFATDTPALKLLEKAVRDARDDLAADSTNAGLKTAVKNAIQAAREGTPTFIGMIKNGTSVANNNALSLKVIVRGVVSVPIWWFTRKDFSSRNHRYMGPFFRHNKSQAKITTDTTADSMAEEDWLKTINRPSGSRAPMDGIECFFKM